MRDHWARPQDAALITEFLAWQAPLLLLLQDLSQATRVGVERYAGRRATEVAAQHRLYPRVVDGRFLKVALVEAAIRKSVADEPAPVEQSLSPFYIELEPHTGPRPVAPAIVGPPRGVTLTLRFGMRIAAAQRLR